MNQTVAILIIPDFDLEVHSIKYQCSTTKIDHLLPLPELRDHDL